MKIKLIISALALIIISACQKKTDCKATVTCVDGQGQALRGADVKLFANVQTEKKGIVTADLKANGITDENGKVSFIFKLPAIYDIKVTSSTYTTAGIIKLEEGKEVNKSLTIQ